MLCGARIVRFVGSRWKRNTLRIRSPVRVANMFGKVSGDSIGFLLMQERNVALKMTNREVAGASVVALDWRIVLCEGRQALRVELKNLVAAVKTQNVLKRDNIQYIES